MNSKSAASRFSLTMTLACAVGLPSYADPAASSRLEGLQARLIVHKAPTTAGDPSFTFSIVNVSDHVRRIVIGPAALEMAVSVTDARGHAVPTHVAFPDDLTTRSRTLEPGDRYARPVSLSDFGYHLPRGRYVIIVTRRATARARAYLRAASTLVVY